jgi:hypothetical protein
MIPSHSENRGLFHEDPLDDFAFPGGFGGCAVPSGAATCGQGGGSASGFGCFSG